MVSYHDYGNFFQTGSAFWTTLSLLFPRKAIRRQGNRIYIARSVTEGWTQWTPKSNRRYVHSRDTDNKTTARVLGNYYRRSSQNSSIQGILSFPPQRAASSAFSAAIRYSKYVQTLNLIISTSLFGYKNINLTYNPIFSPLSLSIVDFIRFWQWGIAYRIAGILDLFFIVRKKSKPPVILSTSFILKNKNRLVRSPCSLRVGIKWTSVRPFFLRLFHSYADVNLLGDNIDTIKNTQT
jgi:hypothetical protein